MCVCIHTHTLELTEDMVTSAVILGFLALHSLCL